MEISSKNQLAAYSCELNVELNHILDHLIDFRAAEGAVLNANILWSFSAAFNNKAISNVDMADRTYHYMVDHFIDIDFGGVFWTVDDKGNPKDTKKQVYALAFTIYAFSEYFMACGDELVKERTLALYHDLVNYCYDKKRGGYFEAFSRDWKDIPNLHLNDKEANVKKTINTHLHVLKAFTNLYRIWPDDELKVLIKELLNDFILHFVDPETKQLNLLFDENWQKISETISYGHNMEASWLLPEAAVVLQEPLLIEEMKSLAVEMAAATLRGLDKEGGLWDEWVQAEAMVGFFNAWQINGDTKFLSLSLETWNFVKAQISDDVKGEWYSGVNNHSSSACLEIIKRIKSIL
jgi:mannobiose 2-epimerase